MKDINNSTCSCGGHSHHENDKCGHTYHGHCNCGHTHHNNCCGERKELTQEEKQFISSLLNTHYFPVAQFVVKSSKEQKLETVALSPVFLESESSSMERVKELGKMLLNLESMGYIELDFDIQLNNYEYSEYKNSKLFNYFKETVKAAAKNDGFLGDIAILECGSIAPTDMCQETFS